MNLMTPCRAGLCLLAAALSGCIVAPAPQAPPQQAALPTAYEGSPEEQTSEPPPPLPDYEQPPPPADGYIWTPGYWAWSPTGYYWVPGAWVEPPYPAAIPASRPWNVIELPYRSARRLTG